LPELPEVETIRTTLAAIIIGREINTVTIYLPKVIYFPGMAAFQTTLTGKKIAGISRRGKYLLILLSGEYTLVIHLRMTGQLVYTKKPEPLPKHTHVIFQLDEGELRFTDIRQFGRIHLLPDHEVPCFPGIKKLGLEPLSPACSLKWLQSGLAGRERKLKQLLLDQSFIAGIGNIYADEILFAAKLHPERPAKSLTLAEARSLYRSIKTIIRAGIRYRGTSVRDYIDGAGNNGSYQEQLKVYGREGKQCIRCGALVVRRRLGGRSAYFCEGCQI
jgi:formamidopyrimidine-DNA glycosylase